jgi:hypothetical protein
MTRYFAGKINGHFSPSPSWQNEWTFLAKSLPASLQGVSAGTCQRALVDESGMIRWGDTIDQKMAAVHGLLCTITPVTVTSKGEQKRL